MFKQTGVDGIMVSRASIGRPWVFEEILHYLKGENIRIISNKEKLETIIKHVNYEVEEKGESIGIKELRKHMSAYTKNMPNSAQIREKINNIETQKELIACLTEYFSM